MKIISLVLFSALNLSACASFAQANEENDVRKKLAFGLKVGLNRSNVYDSQGEEFHSGPKVGFVGGAFFHLPIGRYMGIQPEVLFSQKGFKGTGRLLGSNYEVSRTSNYLDIPLFFALKPARFITFLAGPQISFLLSQTNSFKNGTTTIAQEQVFDNNKGHTNTICSVIGFDINLQHVVFGARFGWDMFNNNSNGSSTPRYKNEWLQATIGFRIY